MNLKVSFPDNKEISQFEPTNIHFAPEYFLLENLYSTLVELDPLDGTLLPGIAERFTWIGNELHFEIRNNLRTRSGKKITAEDAAFSLKRLLVKSGNTHGNFNDLMCPEVKLKSIHDECSGIRVSKNTLILKPKIKKDFLLPMLAAIDFAIIPMSSIDKKTLNIVDYTNTSGPFYVTNDKPSHYIQLKANITHFHYRKDMPQMIEFIPAGFGSLPSSTQLFKKGSIDFISTIDRQSTKELITFAKEQNETIHTTMNIKKYILFFTSKGIKNFTQSERISAGKIIKQSWIKYQNDKNIFKPTKQFFPFLAEGYLDKEQENKLSTIHEKEDKHFLTKKMSIGLLGRYDREAIQNIINLETNKIDLKITHHIPALNEEKRPSTLDAIICSTDAGFLEDISLISYTINAGIFGYKKKELTTWLKDYMNTENKSDRISKLKRKHFEVLKEGILIPLTDSPYSAIIRKEWKLNFPQIYSNSPLWMITKK